MGEVTRQIVVEACSLAATAIFATVSYEIRKFLINRNQLIEQQKKLLKQQLGDAQYERDKQKAKEIVLAIEEMGKEFNWESAVKHSKAVEKITAMTGLSSGDIYDIIKATVTNLKNAK